MFTKLLFCSATFGLLAVGHGKNPVLVDNAGTGDFTKIRDAIASFCPGGANAGGAPPYIINVKAGSGPYDDWLTLDQELEGSNIAGDLEIKSSAAGQKVVLKLQTNPEAQSGSTDDGLYIAQIQHNVTFRDLIFTRSITTAARYPTDDMVRLDEPIINPNMNQISFYGCIFTEAKADGSPMVTDKPGALLPPPARGVPVGVTMTSTPYLFQAWGDVNESQRYLLEDCVLYAGSNQNCRLRNDGGGEEWIKIHNCLSSYSGAGANFDVGGTNPLAKAIITGTDQKSGPLNCTASLFPRAGGHCYWVSSSVDGQETAISNAIAYAQGAAGGNGQNNSSRGVSGGTGKLTLTDLIINVPSIGVVDVTRVPTVFTRVTLHSSQATNAYLFTGTSAAGATLTFADCIFSGPGTKISGAPTGGVTVRNSGFVTAGPDAITLKANAGNVIVEQNNINDDPMYVSKDGTIASYMDVQNSAYAGAGTGGVALAGGANYVGFPAGISEWSIY